MRLSSCIKAMLFSTVVLTSGASFGKNITGAGASFPAPIYAKWADSYYKETGKKVNYQSIGSSAGVKQILAKTVDFGASDAPLSDEQLEKDGLLQFPTVIGGVVPVINIKGIGAGELKLTGEILANIYRGEITVWNDPAIIELNKNLNLPNKKITVIRRADGSGTSFVFTSYLSKVSDIWRKQVGVGASVNWPVGMGGKGNEGVSAYVIRLPNSIGYVEYTYAKQNNLAYIALQNTEGEFVTPSDVAFKASAEHIDWQKTFAQDMTNVKGKTTWPISTATYILMYKKPDNIESSIATLKFFNWALTNGDKSASELDYVAFPDSVKTIIRQSWKQIVDTENNSISY